MSAQDTCISARRHSDTAKSSGGNPGICELSRIGIVLIASAAMLGGCTPQSRAQLPTTSDSVAGLTAYLGIVPAALVRDHVARTLNAMHEPSGHPDEHHVMVALFDTATGARVIDATVQAKLTAEASPPLEGPLQPMTVAGALTYGNYFLLASERPYIVAVTVQRPLTAAPFVFHFGYRHPRGE